MVQAHLFRKSTSPKCTKLIEHKQNYDSMLDYLSNIPFHFIYNNQCYYPFVDLLLFIGHCNMTLVSATDTKALQSRCKGPASPSIVLPVCPTLEGTSCQANLGKRLRTSLKAVDSERTAKHVFNLECSPKKRALTPTGSHATSSSDLKEVVPNFSWLQNVCQALSVADDLLNAERVKFKEEIERLKKEEERASVLSTQLTTAKDSLQELSKKYDKLEQIHKETLEELRHLKESKEKSDKAFDELASELASLSNRAKNRGESRIGEL
jgi:hypothetical protein